jgi:hypothetical protein
VKAGVQMRGGASLAAAKGSAGAAPARGARPLGRRDENAPPAPADAGRAKSRVPLPLRSVLSAIPKARQLAARARVNA